MLVLRFMSPREALLLTGGNQLRNDTNHGGGGFRSEAVGFCFLTIPRLDPEVIKPAARFLSGIADLSVCLIGEVPDDVQWEESVAHFAVVGDQPELSTTEYSLKDFTSWKLYTPPAAPRIVGLWSGDWTEPVFVAEGSKR